MHSKLRLQNMHRFAYAFIFVLSVVIGGSYYLRSAHAETYAVANEAESGIKAGNYSTDTTTTASNGQAIRFGLSSGLPTPDNDPIIAAAGDIACDPSVPVFVGTPGECQQRATAQLLKAIKPTKVITLGDNQYESGTLSNFKSSFDPSWGALKPIITPSIGNHEGGEGGSNAGYFDYFNGAGAASGAAGDRNKGYYSYNINNWHLIALNSNCGTYSFNGSSTGCQVGSPQEVWLKADLAANPKSCKLAYWHIPRFSSGNTHHNDATSDTIYTAFWDDLYAAGTDIVLNGHDHDYERFQPLNPVGAIDATRGITEFVVGTGGKNIYSFASKVKGSASQGTGFGVLKLSLHVSSFDYEYISAPGTTIVDSGSGQCHSSNTP